MGNGWHEWPLVLFTVLGQCVAGALIVSGYGWLTAKDELVKQRIVRSMFFLWLVMGIAFLASVMHLGSPLRAFNSLNRIGASALSNEIASGSLFFAVGGLWWLVAFLGKMPATLGKIWLLLSMLLGLIFVYAMTNVYQIDTVPTWYNGYTTLAFFMTMLLSGPLFAALLLRAAGVSRSPARFAGISVLALLATVAVVVLQGLSLSEIHSSVQNAGALVPDYASLQVWRILLLVAGLGCWICPLVRRKEPFVGGLAAGLLLWGWQKFNRLRPQAPTDYMEALQTDGQFDVSASLVKSLASLLVVASGSAIGREGAMILLAALAASCFAQRFTPRTEWKLWIACGAAAGMAGAYHAPLAGSLFIAEVLFGTLILASLGPVVVSAVVALLTTNLLSDSNALLYTVHLSRELHTLEYVMIVSTGLAAGICGPLFMWLMTASHNGFLRLKLSPPWQLALGGLIVGLLSLLTPAVWGNGYSVVQSYLLSPPLLAVVSGIFICKLLAVLASSGSGAPGGVFTPTLFVGLSVGMLLGQVWGLWLPGSDEIAILLGLTGMATLLAATTHAPIMSTLMVCEMTGEYRLLPGLLIACVLASVLSRTLRHDSIYRQHAAEH
ncbi:TPA: voltage-gated ClC-type chloride channel ClcB [Citrobacter freundii]